jgi:hypothetical protein
MLAQAGFDWLLIDPLCLRRGRFDPRIENADSRLDVIGGVARHDCEAVMLCGRRNDQIRLRKRVTGLAALLHQQPPRERPGALGGPGRRYEVFCISGAWALLAGRRQAPSGCRARRARATERDDQPAFRRNGGAAFPGSRSAALRAIRRRARGPREIWITHEELAQQVGSTRENVWRALKRMGRSGALVCGRGRIEVLIL